MSKQTHFVDLHNTSPSKERIYAFLQSFVDFFCFFYSIPNLQACRVFISCWIVEIHSLTRRRKQGGRKGCFKRSKMLRFSTPIVPSYCKYFNAVCMTACCSRCDTNKQQQYRPDLLLSISSLMLLLPIVILSSCHHHNRSCSGY